MVCRGFLISWLLLVPALVVAAPGPAATAPVVTDAAPSVSAGPADVAALPAEKNPDPWEKYNRTIFRFNDRADRYVLRPVAKGYVAITPRFLRTGITNFFGNLRSPVVILNDALQGKVKQAGSDTVRFVVNTTVGLAGFIDVAVHLKLPLHDEDFGQTLGKWGVNSGPYLMLPFWGPSTIRDGVGLVVDTFTNPRHYLIENEVDWELLGLDVVNSRAGLLDMDDIVQGDRYLFIRDLYLQRRDFATKDGQIDDPFLDDSVNQDEPPAEVTPEAPAAPVDGGATNPVPQTPETPGPGVQPETGPGDAPGTPAVLPDVTAASGPPAAMEEGGF